MASAPCRAVPGLRGLSRTQYPRAVKPGRREPGTQTGCLRAARGGEGWAAHRPAARGPSGGGLDDAAAATTATCAGGGPVQPAVGWGGMSEGAGDGASWGGGRMER